MRRPHPVRALAKQENIALARDTQQALPLRECEHARLEAPGHPPAHRPLRHRLQPLLTLLILATSVFLVSPFTSEKNCGMAPPGVLTPHPSPLTPHPSPLTPHPSPLTPHPSPLTPHPSPLTSCSSYCLWIPQSRKLQFRTSLPLPHPFLYGHASHAHQTSRLVAHSHATKRLRAICPPATPYLYPPTRWWKGNLLQRAGKSPTASNNNNNNIDVPLSIFILIAIAVHSALLHSYRINTEQIKLVFGIHRQ